MRQHTARKQRHATEAERQLATSLRYLEMATDPGLGYHEKHEIARALEARPDLTFTIVGYDYAPKGFVPTIVGGTSYITDQGVDYPVMEWLARERSHHTAQAHAGAIVPFVGSSGSGDEAA